jgi:hypothetical protein
VVELVLSPTYRTLPASGVKLSDISAVSQDYSTFRASRGYADWLAEFQGCELSNLLLFLSIETFRSISDPETSTTADWTRDARLRTVGKETSKNEFAAISGANLAAAIRDVAALRNLKDGWADEDSIAPTEAAVGDAVQFLAKLPEGVPQPRISAAADGEIVIEWRYGENEAVVGFDGDGTFGYTLFSNGRFVPGREKGLIYTGDIPYDLVNYILKIAK